MTAQRVQTLIQQTDGTSTRWHHGTSAVTVTGRREEDIFVVAVEANFPPDVRLGPGFDREEAILLLSSFLIQIEKMVGERIVAESLSRYAKEMQKPFDEKDGEQRVLLIRQYTKRQPHRRKKQLC